MTAGEVAKLGHPFATLLCFPYAILTLAGGALTTVHLEVGYSGQPPQSAPESSNANLAVVRVVARQLILASRF
jgi:hypothetical protein